MLQYELIASYFGFFQLHLDSEFVIGDLGWYGGVFCLFVCVVVWTFFFLLEDAVSKLCEHCGTASPLHNGTKEDGTAEGAHKMTVQISHEKNTSQIL